MGSSTNRDRPRGKVLALQDGIHYGTASMWVGVCRGEGREAGRAGKGRKGSGALVTQPLATNPLEQL